MQSRSTFPVQRFFTLSSRLVFYAMKNNESPITCYYISERKTLAGPTINKTPSVVPGAVLVFRKKYFLEEERKGRRQPLSPIIAH